ncbi:MAG: hypothetical protein SGPRY_012019 [Prymnesium sp.]
MFCEVAEQMPHAMAITDMTIPGLPMVWCNSQMVALTGYPIQYMQGRNCRFLQGKETEPKMVRNMVSGIRSAKLTTVRVTNYRKDGSSFVNVLTLHPVHDSTEEYRYSIGLLSDAVNESAESASLERVRELLPKRFEVSLQPKESTTCTVMDPEQQRLQYYDSLVKFTRLQWSMDWQGSLRHLLTLPSASEAFGVWLKDNSPADDPILHDYLICVSAVHASSERLSITCRDILGRDFDSDDEACSALQAEADSLLSTLTLPFPSFVQSKAGISLVQALLGPQVDESRNVQELIWSKYTVPADCAGWINTFVHVAETYPACIVISDMSIPGNPMFFVNQEFCRTTGYAKHEAQGRNCRFLQGPKTEAKSVALLQDTLRRGVDCHVKITNYRKSGEQFENLLTMRPVHDSNGEYRFCIGVQFEITNDSSLRSKVAKLDKMIKLLPKSLDVPAKQYPNAHTKAETEAEVTTALEEKLVKALEGDPVGPEIAVEPSNSEAVFESNHAEMLEAVDSKPIHNAAESSSAQSPLVAKPSITSAPSASSLSALPPNATTADMAELPLFVKSSPHLSSPRLS